MGRGGVQAKTQVRRLGGMAGVTPGRTESDGKFRRRAVNAVEERLRNANRDIQDARRGKGKRGLEIKDLEKQRKGLADKVIRAREGERAALELAQNSEAQRQLAEAKALEQSAQRQQREQAFIEEQARMKNGGRKAGQVIAQERAKGREEVAKVIQEKERIAEERSRVGQALDYQLKKSQGLETEVERMRKDYSVTKQQLAAKETELAREKKTVKELSERMQAANEDWFDADKKVESLDRESRGAQRRINQLQQELRELRRQGGGHDAEARITFLEQQLISLRSGGVSNQFNAGGGTGGGEGKGPGGEAEPPWLKYLSPEDRAKWAKSQAGIKDKEEKKAEEKAKEEKESIARIFGKGMAETAGPAAGSWLGFSFGSGAMLMWVVMAALAIVLFVKIMGLI